MTFSIHHGLVLAACLLALPMAQAQAETKPTRPDPLNPMAVVPAATHTSPLQRYPGSGEVRVGSWRELNDNVARIGGWRVYTREANQPEPAAPAPSAASPTSAAPAPAPVPAPAASGPMSGHGHGKH